MSIKFISIENRLKISSKYQKNTVLIKKKFNYICVITKSIYEKTINIYSTY